MSRKPCCQCYRNSSDCIENDIVVGGSGEYDNSKAQQRTSLNDNNSIPNIPSDAIKNTAIVLGAAAIIGGSIYAISKYKKYKDSQKAPIIKDGDDFFNEAYSYALNQDFKNAIESYQMAYDLYKLAKIHDDELGHLFLNQGLCYLNLNETIIAEEVFSKIKYTSNLYQERDHLILLGDCYLVLNKYSKAEACYKYILTRLHPENIKAHDRLIKLYSEYTFDEIKAEKYKEKRKKLLSNN